MKALMILVSTFYVCLFSLQAQTEKTVFIEESAGTWCFVCPRGYVYSEEVHQQYGDQVIVVTAHYDDPMEYAEYDTALEPIGYPSGYINRNVFTDFFPANVTLELEGEVGLTAPAGVSVDQVSYDMNTGELSTQITVQAAQDFSGEYAIAAILVENGVTGPAPEYNQVNGYSGGSLEIGNYQFLPSVVSAELMMYNHVARKLLGGFNGVSGTIPSAISDGDEFSETFNWVVPEEYNSDNMYVVGLLIDTESGEIINAGKSFYLNGSSNAAPFYQSSPVTSGMQGNQYVYDLITQDPDYDELSLSITSGPDWLSIGTNEYGEFTISGIPEEIGEETVVLTLSDGTSEVIQQFELEIQEQGFDWLQIGAEYFNDVAVEDFDLSISDDGTMYAVITESVTSSAIVYELVEDSWIPLDTTLVTNASSSVSIIDAEGTLHFKNDQFLYFLNDQGELEFGPFGAPNGTMEDAIFSSENVLYIASSTVFGGSLKSYDGTSWTDYGVYGEGEPLWNKFSLSNSGEPVLIFSELSEGEYRSKVIEWNGSEWEALSDGYITNDASTFESHDIVSDNNGVIYAAIITDENEQMLNIYKYESATWELVHSDVAEGPAQDCKIEINAEGELVVSYKEESSGGRLTCKRYVNGEWILLGLSGFTSILESHDLIVDQSGVPVVAYLSLLGNGSVGVKRYQNTVGITDLQLNSEVFHLFPNPSNDVIFIEASMGDVISIYTSTGMLMKELTSSQSSDLSLDVSELKSGLYLITVHSKNQKRSYKFIKR